MEKTNIMVEFCMAGDCFDPKEITKLFLIESDLKPADVKIYWLFA